MNPVRLIVCSDYLSPWCYNAAVRLRRIEEEFGDRVDLITACDVCFCSAHATFSIYETKIAIVGDAGD